MSRLRKVALALAMVVAVVLSVPLAARAADGDVAQIGDTTYATLDEAIAAAEDGATIELLDDAYVSKTLNKTMTIDGRGNTLTSENVLYGFGEKGKTINLTLKNMIANFSYEIEVENPEYDSDLALFYINANTNFTFDNVAMNLDGSGASNRLHGFYFDGGSTGTFTLENNSVLNITNFPEDAFEWSGEASKVLIKNSTFVSNANRSGFAGSFNLEANDSDVTVINSTGNGSNGTNYVFKNSTVSFAGNKDHGLSAGNLIIDDESTVSCKDNGANGIHTSGTLTISGGSTVTVENNACDISSEWTIPGAVHVGGAGESKIEASTVTITDNAGSGIYQKNVEGKLVITDSAVMKITGNTANKLGYGGGIYANGEVSLGSGVSLYNNHAGTAGDDIYVAEDGSITMREVGQNWDLDGTRVTADERTLTTEEYGCSDAIDGWYDDSEGVRWEAHNAPYHIDLFDEFKDGVATVDGTLALKAAHGIIPIDPSDPDAPEWTTSKSKTATPLDANNISKVTLSLPAEDYAKSMDVVFVIDDTHAGSGIFKEAVNGLLDELAKKDKLDVNVGIIAFDAVSRDWLSVTSNGNYEGLVSIKDEDSLGAIKTAVATELAYDGEGQQKKIGGTNTEWPVAMATDMLSKGEGEDKYLIMFSDLYGYVYRGELEIDGQTYNDVPLSKRCNQRTLGELTISTPMFDSWTEVYNGRSNDRPDWDSFFRANKSGNNYETWTDYWTIYRGVTAEGSDQENAPQTDYGKTYFTPFEKSACMTYDNILNAASSGIQVVLVNNDFDPDHRDGSIGQKIQSIKNGMLDDLSAQGFTVIRETAKDGDAFSSDQMDEIFSTLENELVQLVDAGSYVVDEMGSGTCDGFDYDFDFVTGADNLVLTVGGTQLNTVELEDSEKDGATAAYKFGTTDDDDQFVLKYYKNGTTISDEYGTRRYDECFVWEINVPVMKDNTVQLTYSVELVNPTTQSGSYGTYDEDGSENYDGLHTNNAATLYPVDSEGNHGQPQNFRKPTVSYEVGSATITPADITIYMGGDEGYEGVIEDAQTGEAMGQENNSLPEPGFYVTLPDYVNEALERAGYSSEESPANLSDLLEIYVKDDENPDNNRSWSLVPYGDEPATSSSQIGYIYRVVPAAGQDPVRLQYTHEESVMTSDDFDPISALYNNYDMEIYSGGVNLDNVRIRIADDKTLDFDLQLTTAPGELTIRYVTGNQDEVMTEVIAKDNLADARADNPNNAIAVLPEGTTYTINDSSVEVSLDPESPYCAVPSLLFDELVDSGDTEDQLADSYTTHLQNKALTLIDEDLDEPQFQSMYLDLVDVNNGNVWLSASNPVTVYWPTPEDTDENTDFYLVHFDGLDREMNNDSVIDEIDEAVQNGNAKEVEVEKTEYGIKFETESFSPFVLVWDASDGGDTPNPPITDNYGDLKISKTVTGDLADPNDEFTFRVTVTGAGTMSYGGVEFTDDVATITLKGGETVTIKNLPKDAAYTVEETNGLDYELVSSKNASGTIPASSVTASFVNDKSEPETLDPTTPVNPGGTKVLLDAQGNSVALSGGEFTFRLTAKDGAPLPAGATDGSVTVTNRADGTFVFGDIVFDEAGTYTYELTEVAGTAEGVTYDGSTHTLVVVVSDKDADGDGRLDIESLTYDGGTTLPTFTNETTSDEPPAPDPDQPGTDEPAEPTTPGVPDTGDHTVSALPAVLALGGVALVGGALAVARRRVR